MRFARRRWLRRFFPFVSTVERRPLGAHLVSDTAETRVPMTLERRRVYALLLRALLGLRVWHVCYVMLVCCPILISAGSFRLMALVRRWVTPLNSSVWSVLLMSLKRWCRVVSLRCLISNTWDVYVYVV